MVERSAKSSMGFLTRAGRSRDEVGTSETGLETYPRLFWQRNHRAEEWILWQKMGRREVCGGRAVGKWHGFLTCAGRSKDEVGTSKTGLETYPRIFWQRNDRAGEWGGGEFAVVCNG